jgi:hypothetical protein
MMQTEAICKPLSFGVTVAGTTAAMPAATVHPSSGHREVAGAPLAGGRAGLAASLLPPGTCT